MLLLATIFSQTKNYFSKLPSSRTTEMLAPTLLQLLAAEFLGGLTSSQPSSSPVRNSSHNICCHQSCC